MINLERSAERRARARAAFGAQGIEINFHAGVDGAKSDLRESADYPRAERLARYGGDLTSREIGCYMSHLGAMRHCVEQGIARAIIMEDDVVPTPRLNSVLGALAKAPESFEFVRLMGLRPRRSLPIGPVTSDVQMTWPTHGMCGAQGYYLTAPAMKKFLAEAHRIILPFDVMIDRYWETGVTVFALDPYVIGLNEGGPVSDIGERRDLWADGSHQVLHAKLKLGKLGDRAARSAANVRLRLHLAEWRRQAADAFSTGS